jgi:hypothetical protein
MADDATKAIHETIKIYLRQRPSSEFDSFSNGAGINKIILSDEGVYHLHTSF